MKKGISMITLAITIGVIVILTSIVILNVSDTNMITQATDTVNKYNEVQYDMYDIVKNTQEELEGISGQKKTVIFNGLLEGLDGAIVLPLQLNDTSKQYILDISSTLYTGQVLLNVYGVFGNVEGYIGAGGVDATNSYTIELRHIWLEFQSDITVSPEDIFGTSEMALLMYQSDGESAAIVYNPSLIGSEINLTKITQVDRKYTMFAKLLTRLINLQPISAYDMKEAMLFCTNSNVLGYDYLDVDLSYGKLNDALERKTMQSILNTRVRELTDLEYCITDQVSILAYVGLMLSSEASTSIYINDEYTLINFFEENQWLNEYYYRTVGNTVVPFTVLYSDYILMDLNEDGIIGGGMNITDYKYAQQLPTGNAGAFYRAYADMAAVMWPVLAKCNEDISQLPIMEQIYINEIQLHSGLQNTNGVGCITMAVRIWDIAYSVYGNCEMDTMYSLMYNNGLTINMAGLKMGWNSIISEYFRYEGFSMLPQYDIRMDSDAINRQGVRGIINELYAYISAVQETINPGTTE